MFISNTMLDTMIQCTVYILFSVFGVVTEEATMFNNSFTTSPSWYNFFRLVVNLTFNGPWACKC